MTSGRRITSQGARANYDSRLSSATLTRTRRWVRSMLGVVVSFRSELSDCWEGVCGRGRGVHVSVCVCVAGVGDDGYKVLHAEDQKPARRRNLS